MTEIKEVLDIENQVVKQAFVMANYMHLYNCSSELALSVLIPEDKRNGESELQSEKPMPKSP